MSTKLSRIGLWFLSAALVLASQACSPAPKGTTATSEAPLETQASPVEAPSTPASPTESIPENSLSPTLTPTSSGNASPTFASPTLATVTITAVKGNLFVRRGPDVAFNPVSVLMEGQSAPALARDVLGKWVQIEIPGETEKTGWVSIQSKYSLVSGNVRDLPNPDKTDWPVLASVQNCTYHQMEVRPGEITILPITDFPDNSVRLNPGIYTIHDVEVAGSPTVLTVEIREGSEVEVLKDGNGDRRKCPES
jgi:hypothetical protein